MRGSGTVSDGHEEDEEDVQEVPAMEAFDYISGLSTHGRALVV